MTITEIAHFSAESSISKGNSVRDTFQRARKALEGLDGLERFVLGTHVQDKNAVQITSNWADPKDEASIESPVVRNLGSLYGEPRNVYHVNLNRSPFGPDGPAEANVVEYAHNYFPASRVTPEFQKKIEADFLKFNEICCRNMDGKVGQVAFGWVLEKQDHQDIKGEKAYCLLVMRGWESMGHFEKFVKTDTFKEAIQVLLAWNTPYEMWHVERETIGEQ